MVFAFRPGKVVCGASVYPRLHLGLNYAGLLGLKCVYPQSEGEIFLYDVIIFSIPFISDWSLVSKGINSACENISKNDTLSLFSMSTYIVLCFCSFTFFPHPVKKRIDRSRRILKREEGFIYCSLFLEIVFYQYGIAV